MELPGLFAALTSAAVLGLALLVALASGADARAGEPAREGPVFAGPGGRAEFDIADIFGDHMVLQQGRPVRVWGTGLPGRRVTVAVAGKDAGATVDEDGRWIAALPALETGGPHEMTVAHEGGNTVTFVDVLVGEVWFVSGQSNAAMGVKGTKHFEDAKKEADLPRLRLNHRRGWEPSDAETFGDCSAVGWYCARELARHLPDTPVGVIQRARGGTAIRSYISPETMQARPVVRREILEPWTRYAEELRPHYETLLRFFPKKDWPVDDVPDPAHLGPAAYSNPHIDLVTPYTIAGAMWYQGESDAWGFAPAEVYEPQLRALVAEWRSRWRDPELPVLMMQLPNYVPTPLPRPDDMDPWALVQEAQARLAAEDPNIGLVVSIDTGEGNIHPKHKRFFGRRAAAVARAMVYGHDVAHQGPTFREMTVDGNTVTIHLDHAEGLAAAWDVPDGAPTAVPPPETTHLGFAVAGEDRVFHWPEARIEGETVVLACEAVERPVAVRYAFWSSSPWSLVNGAGLPAGPFRTDDWPADINADLPDGAWPREVYALYAGDAPAVDGASGDAAWSPPAHGVVKPTRLATAFRRRHTLGEPPARTEAHVRWDERALYVFVRCESPAGHVLKAGATARDDDLDIFADDYVEVVLDPDGDGETYTRIVVNAAGTVYDEKAFVGKNVNALPLGLGMLRMTRDTRVEKDVDIEVAVERIPAGGDAGEGYAVEMKIPWKSLGRGAPKPKQEMGVQFVRSFAETDVTYEWTPTGRDRHTGAMMPPRMRNGYHQFHAAARLGRLRFWK